MIIYEYEKKYVVAIYLLTFIPEPRYRLKKKRSTLKGKILPFLSMGKIKISYVIKYVLISIEIMPMNRKFATLLSFINIDLKDQKVTIAFIFPSISENGKILYVTKVRHYLKIKWESIDIIYQTMLDTCWKYQHHIVF